MLLLLTVLPALADGPSTTPYSPYAGPRQPDRVYWGDTHLHTSLSIDAYAFGNRAIGPAEAYRFAKGGVVTAFNGMPVRLKRPLDFLVVADHASNMGLLTDLEKGRHDGLLPAHAESWTRRYDAARKGVPGDAAASIRLWQEVSGEGFMAGNAMTRARRASIWEQVARLADEE